MYEPDREAVEAALLHDDRLVLTVKETAQALRISENSSPAMVGGVSSGSGMPALRPSQARRFQARTLY